MIEHVVVFNAHPPGTFNDGVLHGLDIGRHFYGGDVPHLIDGDDICERSAYINRYHLVSLSGIPFIFSTSVSRVVSRGHTGSRFSFSLSRRDSSGISPRPTSRHRIEPGRRQYRGCRMPGRLPSPSASPHEVFLLTVS